MFTLLPKSPESGQSTLAYQTKPIFVMDSEWLKMTVAFDTKKNRILNQENPNPWLSIISDKNEEVRIFGSYTILVNSIFICIVTIIIIFMLGICLVNCMHYPPKFLQNHQFPFSSKSFPMENCAEENFSAIPEVEVFITDTESPVET